MNDEKSILMEIKKLLHLLQRHSRSVLACDIKKVDLTPVQFMVVKYVSEQSKQKVYQRDIEIAFNIRRSTVTSIIKAIERKGYIKRESVSSDARLKRLVLTTKTKKIEQTMLSEMKVLESRVKKGVTQQELDMFFSVMAKINNNLKDDK